ncbi:MAG TPA: LPS export ABC transporter periplasmic protein LptC [Flavobacteriia bacterium]|jgi:LPS export ABC transporter protein LptC|nr:LPS export ABC transporter periplasmic protein LptC [Flavobacteriia bacterium]
MLQSVYHNLKSIAIYIVVAMLFSCGNDLKEVQDFLADKNLPVGIAKNVDLIHTDSGKVKTKLITPLLYDYSNRKAHPYQEFPKGIKIITFDKKGDSITLTADYTRTYTKTGISEVKGHVVVISHKENSKLFTEQLFWDQTTHYIYTEKAFTLITKTDTIKGKGFESNENLTKYTMKDISGPVYINESVKP